MNNQDSGTVGQGGKEILFYAKFEISSHFSKKNSNRFDTRTGHTYRLPKSRQIEDYILLMLRRHKIDQKISQPIRYPVQSMFVFGIDNFFTKKGLINKKIPDLSNLYQGPEDLLQKAKIIEDDHLIFSHDGSRRIYSPKNFIEITLFKFED